MLVTKVDNVYEMALPGDVRRVLEYASVGVSFGLNSSTSFLTCLGLRGFYARLVLWMLVPPVARLHPHRLRDSSTDPE